jgi:anaerobic selenocysteine-containing dehydrogenase
MTSRTRSITCARKRGSSTPGLLEHPARLRVEVAEPHGLVGVRAVEAAAELGQADGGGDRVRVGVAVSGDVDRAQGAVKSRVRAMGTAYRTCPFCEATCGLEVTLDGGEVVQVRGDADDVFSRGFLCPKGVGLKALHEDPDRLRTPAGQGRVRDASRGDVGRGVRGHRRAPAADPRAPRARRGRRVRRQPGRHGMTGLGLRRVLLKALGSRTSSAPATVDQYPKQMASAHMFGSGTTSRSPTSIAPTTPHARGQPARLERVAHDRARTCAAGSAAAGARAGRLVVVDPRRSRTAQVADEHVWIRPGTDALLLMALVHVLVAEGWRPRGEHLAGVDDVAALAEPVHARGRRRGHRRPAGTVRRLARELAAAPPRSSTGASARRPRRSARRRAGSSTSSTR